MLKNEVIDQFLTQWQVINRHLRKGMLTNDAIQITRIQWLVLRYVHKTKDCTMGQLAEKCGVKLSTVSQMTDRLEKNGLLERVTSTRDTRQKFVRLTKKGEEFVSSALSIWADLLAQSLGQFTEEEQTQFIEFLTRMAKAVTSAKQSEDLNLAQEV